MNETPLDNDNYRKAWLAGYNQAMDDMNTVAKQILAQPVKTVNDNAAETE